MRILFSFVCFKMRNMKFNGGKINGNDWLFCEIDSEKINQLLESTKKPLMDNIHDTLSGLRRLDIDKRWDFYTLA